LFDHRYGFRKEGLPGMRAVMSGEGPFERRIKILLF
jgi:hypothetical protein